MTMRADDYDAKVRRLETAVADNEHAIDWPPATGARILRAARPTTWAMSAMY